jgi:hypothetical protein
MLAKLHNALQATDRLARLIESPCAGVYTFDLYGAGYCGVLRREFAQHESEAPNSMNKYGLVLRDAGHGALCEQLLRDVVAPLSRRLFPHVGHLGSYHGFTVSYDKRKQGSLDLHVDDSLVTLNVCLSSVFTGGRLVFRDEAGKIQARLDHRIGRAVLHLGAHQHQAQHIRTGKRTNLILWCRR